MKQQSVTTIRIGGAPNFRDLGGQVTSDGRRIRHRRLFRSDHLSSISEADREALTRLGIRNILDFRSDPERVAFPCRMTDVPNVSLAIQTDTAQRLQELMRAGHRLDAAKGREIMCDIYRRYIRAHSRSFHAFFGHLLEHDGPHLFHCTAGKDRTGTAAAMLLTALGVPWRSIVADYLLTNTHWKMKPHQGTGLPDEVRHVLGIADADYLSAAFQVIDSEYGGWEAYARDHLGIGPREHAQLRERYLEG